MTKIAVWKSTQKKKEMDICFTPDDNVRNSMPSIVIEDNFVETVEYPKLLGLPLSNALNWNRHVDCIVEQVATEGMTRCYVHEVC